MNLNSSPKRIGASPKTNIRLSELGTGIPTTARQSPRRINENNHSKSIEDSNSLSQGPIDHQDDKENTINVPKLKSIINKHKNGKPEIGRHFRNMSMESELNASENMTSCDHSYLQRVGSHKRLSSKGSPLKKVSQHGNRVGKKHL